MKKIVLVYLFCFSTACFSQVKINIKGIIAAFPTVPDSLKSFVDSSIISCDKETDTLKAKCIIDKGYKYNSLNYNKAVALAEKGFTIAEQTHNFKQMSSALMLVGYAYFWTGKYERALFFYFQALTISQQIKDRKNEAWILKEIGILYSKNGRKNDAAGYYLTSMKIFTELNDAGGMADLNSEIGFIYEYNGNSKEALKYYYKSYFLYKKLNSDLGCSYAADYISGVHTTFKQYDSAIYYEKISLDLRIKINDKHAQSVSINNMGEIYFAQKEYKKASEYFKNSSALAKEAGFVDLEQYGYDYLSKCYSELKDYKNAFIYQKLHSEIKDSIFNQSQAKQLSELQTKYETEKKDNQIKNLEEEKTISELKLSTQSLKLQKRNYLLVFVLLVLALALVALYFWLGRLKLKNSVAKDKAVKETEENERLRIAKDIHDDLGSGLSKINFLSEIIYSKSESLPEIRHSSESVKETAKKMIENMRDLIWALNPENTTLPNLIARMREYSTDYLEDLQIDIKYLMPDTIPDYAINKESHRELFMLVKETLNNISKHSNASEVSFNFNINTSDFSFSIKDNGNGFDEETVKKGNGLRNMKNRITALGGLFEIISRLDDYTIIKVSVPFKNIIRNNK